LVSNVHFPKSAWNDFEFIDSASKAQYEIGIILIFITSFLALAVSFYVVKDSGFSSRSWYHEIMLCGVDKLSMSITCLSPVYNGSFCFTYGILDCYKAGPGSDNVVVAPFRRVTSSNP
jgi:hypothetical protein